MQDAAVKMLRLRTLRQVHTKTLTRGVSTDTYAPPAGGYSLLNALNSDQIAAKQSQELQRLSLINKANVKGFQATLPKGVQLKTPDLRPHSLFVRSVDSDIKGSSDEWSSPNDDIVLSPSQFKIDNNLWGLIDAAIKAGQLQRAQAFIANLGHAKIWREDRIRLCARNLAEAFIETSSVDASIAWLSDMNANLGLHPDAQMYAHLLSKVVDEEGDVARLLFHSLPKQLTAAQVVEEIQIVGLERLPKVLEVLRANLYAFDQFGDAYIELFEELTGESILPKGPESDQTPEERTQMLKAHQRGSETVVTHTNKGDKVVGIEIIKNMLLQVDGDPRVSKFVDQLPYKHEIPAELLDPSKKISLFNIKNSLSKAHQADFEQRLDKLNMSRQLDIELRGIEAAGALWEARMEQSKAYTGMVQFQAHMHEWKQKMVPLIEAELKRVAKLETHNDVYPYLKLLKPDTMALVTIIEMMRLQTTVGRSTDSGVKTTNLVTSVGMALETEYRCSQWSELLGKKRTFLSKLTGLKRRLKVQEMVNHDDLQESAPAWALDVRARVGGMLVDLLIKVARIPVEAEDPVTGKTVKADVPVFGHSYALIRRQRQGVVRMHHSMTERIAGNQIHEHDSEDFVTPQFLPMVAKPKPWVGWKNGGYYISQASVMRAKESSEQTAYLGTASERGDLERLFAGLNKLGSTAWTVNAKIFATMSQVWNTGEGYLDIPAVNQDHSLPDPPEHNDPGARAEWRRECTVIINKRKSDHSVRCDANYKLEIARAHIGEKMFFPHNVDFRGRAYPLSPHFNHLGSDLSRGLLMFWEGKELGNEGLKWLKVHMANLYGMGKASYEEREQFTDSLVPQIREVVKDPLNKQNLLWHNADYPWQFLAACHELIGALDSPDPAKFVSHIPVQQDGSCNGLQHYAALGGDIDGARQVNLTPFDRPQDVYAEVAAIVSDLVAHDAKGEHEHAHHLVGRINRKIVKPTVMTNVYGVTFIGAKAQIYSQLKEQYNDIPNLEGAAHYLATRVFSAMRSLFMNAHDIQDWLTECARRITKTVRPSATEQEIKQMESLSSVIWTSPIGLPVVQPYRKTAKRQVETALQSVFLQDSYTLYGVQSRKQAQAFPPNFVHSLDASHMLLTALNLGEDVSFASVHDSYWTHACDVPEMNRVLREQFVKLHSLDIVGNLKNELMERYGPFYSRVDLAIDKTELGEKLKKKKALNSSVFEQLEEDLEYRKQLNGTPQERQQALDTPSTVEILEQHRPLDKYLAMKVVSERVGGKVIQTMVEAEGGEKKRHYLTKFEIDEPPKKGALNLDEVLVSPYFFS